jgi:hypothetical protein
MSSDKTEKLKERNLGIISSVRKHLQRPMRYRDLYFIPPYEKAMLLMAIEGIEGQYSSGRNTYRLNSWFLKKLKEVRIDLGSLEQEARKSS